MELSPSARALSRPAARTIAVVYTGLVVPVVLLTVATAIARHDYALLITAGALLGASIVAGAVTSQLVRALSPVGRQSLPGTVLWAAALGTPHGMTWIVGRATSSLWLRSSALSDAALDPDLIVWLLSFAVALTALLLGTRLSTNTVSPVVLRHRRALFTERTLFALVPVLVLGSLAKVFTSYSHFVYGEADELRARLPSLYREARRYPDHFLTQYRYGNALSRAGDCAMAVAPLQRAVSLRPDDGSAEDDLAYALTCTRRYEEAIAPARVATRLTPGESRPYYHLAWALEQTHDREGAEDVYRQIVEHWPNEAVARARWALLRFAGGDRHGALTMLHRAMATDDTSYWMRLTAAELYSNAAMLPEAMTQYRALAKSNPANVWMWGQYGSTAYLAGQLVDARAAFDHVDSIAPRAFEAMPPWQQMRDAARKGILSSALPPIPAHQPGPNDTLFVGLRPTR